MPIGPGRYGKNAERLLLEHGGTMCVVILIGSSGPGFDVATSDPKLLRLLPQILRRTAKQMETEIEATIMSAGRRRDTN